MTAPSVQFRLYLLTEETSHMNLTPILLIKGQTTWISKHEQVVEIKKVSSFRITDTALNIHIISD